MARGLAKQQEMLRERITRCLPFLAQERIVVFLGEMCGLPFPAEGYPMLQAARHDPKIMRDAVRDACIDWLRAECAAQPVVLVLDDLQWSDKLTVSLVDEALQELDSAPFCVIALARPEVHASFPKLWQCCRLQEISLRPLSRKACTQLIVQVLGKDVDPEALEGAIVQSAGNALFLEELIRAIAEGKPEERTDTVIAMLQARIGRLDAWARRTIRAAAVFGQACRRSGIGRLLGISEGALELESALSALVDAELIQPHPKSRLGNESEYGFRHALVRDAAYGLLTDSDKLVGHYLAGEFLEAAGEHDAILIAEHFERGGARERAVKHFISAADWAASNKDLDSVLKWTEHGVTCGATDEALGVLRSLQAAAHTWQDAWAPACARGMEALALLPQGSVRWCKLMTPLFVAASGIQPQLFGQLMAQFAMAQPQTEARLAYVEAASWLVAMLSGVGQRGPAQSILALLEQVSLSLSQTEVAAWGHVRIGQAIHARMLGRDPWANLLLSRAGSDSFEQAQDWRNLVILGTLQGSAQHELGNAQAAERILRETVKVAHRVREPLVVGCAAAYLALFLSTRMENEAIEEAVQTARVAIAAQQTNPFVNGLLHCALAHGLMRLGALPEAAETARAACAIFVFSPALRITAYTVSMRVLLKQGYAAEAQSLGEKGLQDLRAGDGGGYGEVAFLLVLAEAHQAVGAIAAAQDTLAQALLQMNLRADQIPDPGVREQFLTQVTENVRIRELTQP